MEIGRDGFAGTETDVTGRLFERSCCDLPTLPAAKVFVPTLHQPCGAGKGSRFVRPFHRCSIYFSKHGIYESRGRSAVSLGELDRFVDSSVNRNAIEISELKQSHP